jgi:hypothetical protein
MAMFGQRAELGDVSEVWCLFSLACTSLSSNTPLQLTASFVPYIFGANAVKLKGN